MRVDDQVAGVEARVLVAVEVGGEGFEVDPGNAHLVAEQAFAVVADDEVDLVAFGEQLIEQAGRVDGPRGAGDTEDETLAAGFGRAAGRRRLSVGHRGSIGHRVILWARRNKRAAPVGVGLYDVR